MRTVLLILLLSIAAACAADPPDDTGPRFQAYLNRQLGKSEADLVRAMRRMPDASYQPDTATRMLRWQFETTFTTPGKSPEYVAVGTSIVPVGGRAPASSTEVCNVEWLIEKGVARSYTTRGKGCP